jgi:predicted enzyme related to lactoylglutathione lyase
MLYVRDLERMARFYREMLGIKASNQNCTNAWATFDTGDVRFVLHAIPEGVAMSIEIACPPVPREHEPVKLIFEVEDVEGERERLESLGVQTLRRPWQESGQACDVVDPEGNIFQLCSSGSNALR